MTALADPTTAPPAAAASGRVPLLALQGVARRYVLPRTRLWQGPPVVQALAGVDLKLPPGRSLGVVGESGSGKSTLARLAMALEPPSEGRVHFEGRDLNRLDAAALRAARRDFQMVFQDPYGSLDPRQRVERIVAEPLHDAGAGAAARREAVAQALDAVGLRASDAQKYPHEFSGGQRQRIALARALITRPKLIVADEPVSALDVSVQAQVLNLMIDLQQQFGLSFLLISHDLAVVDHVCDEVAVLFAGRVVEQGPAGALFGAPAHPYTRALIEAVPRLDAPPRRGAAPVAASAAPAPAASSADPAPAGCAYAPRCPWRVERCVHERPVLRVLGGTQRVACHRAETLPTP